MATPSAAPQKGKIIKATNKSSLPKTGFITDLSIGKDSELVFDPYSKKYYGTDSYDQLKASVSSYKNQALSRYNQIAQPFGSLGFGAPAPYMSMGGLVDPVGDAKKAYETAMATAFIPNKEDYIQSNDVINSYKAYGNDWDTYFQRNYQNPRVAEENANKRTRTEQAQQRNQTLAASLQDLIIQADSSPSSMKTRGTGINSRSDIFSGGLEAGLGV